jgi:hypothetical protein
MVGHEMIIAVVSHTCTISQIEEIHVTTWLSEVACLRDVDVYSTLS